MILLSKFKIKGHSMEPTIIDGQTVLVSSIPYLFSKLKIGDIVLIRHSGKGVPDGTPASRISSQSLHRLRRFWTHFVRQNDKESRFFIKRIAKINEDIYFLKGDNDKDSLDSKDFGWIAKKEILGKVVYISKNP